VKEKRKRKRKRGRDKYMKQEGKAFEGNEIREMEKARGNYNSKGIKGSFVCPIFFKNCDYKKKKKIVCFKIMFDGLKNKK
jgi:hypothetical protein